MAPKISMLAIDRAKGPARLKALAERASDVRSYPGEGRALQVA